ncbi:MAG TPA: LamG domain-containing protein [Parafilimonas sp.]|nr:LamG domain-containing protein [Parafilimonas sp.]
MKQLTAFTILFCVVIFSGCSKSGSSTPPPPPPPPPPDSLDSGLIAYYPFTGNANDASGNNFDLTVHAAALTNDRNGSANKAYHFNGIDATMDVPAFAGTDSLPTFAVSVWVKAEKKGGFLYAFVNSLSPGATEYQYVYGDTTTNNLTVANMMTHYYSTGGSTYKFFQVGVRDMAGEWTHLVLVQDHTSTALYVNDVKASTESLDPLSISYAGGGLIGAMPGQDLGHFNGDIDELRFYDRALTAAEIQRLYNE